MEGISIKKLTGHKINYGFHYTDFKETHVRLTPLKEGLMYQILSESVDKWRTLV
jgi:hypothetical protein